jgi:glyoxylase-like metal-dependent hydrolase (beta-lactamase superfamily II)
MPVRSYVVVHPKGTLVWDTGIDDAIGGEPDGRRIMEAIVFKVPRTMLSQLEEIEVDPGEVDYLALSHLHIDHVGNVGMFPNATVLLQQAEFDAGYGPNAEELTLIPETYAALNGDNVETVDGEHDVFGDGTVIMKPLPGHTPGHQGLLLWLRNAGPILLAGDVAYSAGDYADGAVRRANVDVDESARSIEAAKRLERELGASVWLHHDREAQRNIRCAPQSYE